MIVSFQKVNEFRVVEQIVAMFRVDGIMAEDRCPLSVSRGLVELFAQPV